MNNPNFLYCSLWNSEQIQAEQLNAKVFYKQQQNAEVLKRQIENDLTIIDENDNFS